MRLDKSSAENAARILKALAHPVRLRIIESLIDGEKCVSDIIKAVGGKQSITSQHLNMMRDKGVLSCRRIGPMVYYRIEKRDVITVLKCFCGLKNRHN